VLFKNATGTDIVHIPYKGGGPALAGLLGGDVQMMIDLMVSVYPNAKAGKIRGLGVTTKQRVSTAPDLPTLDESGLPGFEIAASDGVYAPAGTPRAIVDKLNAAFRQALEDREVRENLVSRGAFPVPGTPDDLAKHVATEYPVWIKLVKDSGAKVD
jgi:tripartite-type tricarboxylate transporter receptor subunit TctC